LKKKRKATSTFFDSRNVFCRLVDRSLVRTVDEYAGGTKIQLLRGILRKKRFANKRRNRIDCMCRGGGRGNNLGESRAARVTRIASAWRPPNEISRSKIYTYCSFGGVRNVLAFWRHSRGESRFRAAGYNVPDERCSAGFGIENDYNHTHQADRPEFVRGPRDTNVYK